MGSVTPADGIPKGIHNDFGKEDVFTAGESSRCQEPCSSMPVVVEGADFHYSDIRTECGLGE